MIQRWVSPSSSIFLLSLIATHLSSVFLSLFQSSVCHRLVPFHWVTFLQLTLLSSFEVVNQNRTTNNIVRDFQSRHQQNRKKNTLWMIYRQYRISLRARKRDHGTLLLRFLHWLLIRFRIQYKLSVMF